MLDYPAARAVQMVLETGSFDRAAAALGVTPSAVSQRVRGLEERLGTALIDRGPPVAATEAGARLARHMARVALLEQDLATRLPGLTDTPRPTLAIAANADSLGTWLMPALAAHARETGHLLDILLDDEDHTADWLARGRVLAAVTADPAPQRGAALRRLGALRYHATASPDFVARHFAGGVTAQALARAPALTFNRKDRLQDRWAQAVAGQPVPLPTHWLPSTQAFVEGALAGMGWALNPAPLVADHLAAGRLVELVPGATLDQPLHWQVSRQAAAPLRDLTRAVTQAARVALVAPDPAQTPAISARIASAAATGSGAAQIGRPITT